jgi:hypothetical protein
VHESCSVGGELGRSHTPFARYAHFFGARMSLAARRHVIAVALLSVAACVGTLDVVTLENPARATLLDDAAPAETTRVDPALD